MSVEPTQAPSRSVKENGNRKTQPKRHVFDGELIRARISGNSVWVWLNCPTGFARYEEDNIFFHGLVEHVDTYMVKFCVMEDDGEVRVVWVAKNSMCGVHIEGSEPTKEAKAILDELASAA